MWSHFVFFWLWLGQQMFQSWCTNVSGMGMDTFACMYTDGFKIEACSRHERLKCVCGPKLLPVSPFVRASRFILFKKKTEENLNLSFWTENHMCISWIDVVSCSVLSKNADDKAHQIKNTDSIFIVHSRRRRWRWALQPDADVPGWERVLRCRSPGRLGASPGARCTAGAETRRAQQQRPHVPQRAALRLRVRSRRQLHHRVSCVTRGRRARWSQPKLWVNCSFIMHVSSLCFFFFEKEVKRWTSCSAHLKCFRSKEKTADPFVRTSVQQILKRADQKAQESLLKTKDFTWQRSVTIQMPFCCKRTW